MRNPFKLKLLCCYINQLNIMMNGRNDVNILENPLKYRGFCYVFFKLVTYGRF